MNMLTLKNCIKRTNGCRNSIKGVFISVQYLLVFIVLIFIFIPEPMPWPTVMGFTKTLYREGKPGWWAMVSRSQAHQTRLLLPHRPIIQTCIILQSHSYIVQTSLSSARWYWIIRFRQGYLTELRLKQYLFHLSEEIYGQSWSIHPSLTRNHPIPIVMRRARNLRAYP